MLRILEERAFPFASCASTRRAFARAASSPFAGGEVTCEVLRPGCFDGLDLVIVDVDDPLAVEWAPQAAAAGARVIDNSAAFRMDPDVPLVVAEVNPEDLRSLPKGIASCPNCTTMVLVTALAPLHRAARIDRMVVSTYQSVSGAGSGRASRARRAVDEARRPRRRAAARGHARPRRSSQGEVWPKPIAGNVDPARRLGEGSRATRRRSGSSSTRRARSSTTTRSRAPSRACASPCTSATRCRRTLRSAAR